MQTVLECRQCGASLDIDEGRKIVYCQYCGSANAISYADRFGLYNRANHLRRLNEFDRAIGVYEDILNGDPHDAEDRAESSHLPSNEIYSDVPGHGF